MIRLVVIDLDGTLLNADHLVGERTKLAIQALHQKGVEVMIATGRHFQDVLQIAQQLEVPLSLITSNGARVHNANAELLYENHIPKDIAQQILAISADFDVHRNIYQGEKWLVEAENLALVEAHSATGFAYTKVDFADLDCDLIDKFYFTNTHDALVPLEKVLRERFADELYITFTTEIYLEAMNKGVSKGVALSSLCAQKGLQPDEVMAFGDGCNDIDMLQWVGHPVVMQNARPELKQAIPDGAQARSNAEEGVASYLQQYFDLSV